MAAGDDQGQGILREGAELELGDRYVSYDVVDAIQGLFRRPSQRLGTGNAYSQASSQSRTSRDRYGIHLGQVHIRILQGLGDDRHKGLSVCPRGDLRYDAAVAGVLVHGGCDHVGQQSVALDQGGSGLVAGGFDAQHQGLTHGQ